MAKKEGKKNSKNSKQNKEANKKLKELSQNPWAISTIILAAIAILSLIVSLSGTTCEVISEEAAKQKILDFASSQGLETEIVSVEDKGSLYQVTISIQDQEVPTYVTKDGKNFISAQGVVPFEEIENQNNQETQQETQPAEVKKSDTPIFEVFLSPYCPYGLQYEKGLIQTYKLLKDKADIKIKLMNPTHMQEELPQIQKELCIQEEYGNEEYFQFLENVVYNNEAAICYNEYHGANLQTGEQMQTENTGNGEWFIECMAPINEQAMNKAGVNSEIITTCVAEKGDQLFQQAAQYAQSKQVSGSPTPKLNGADLQGDLRGRSPETIKNAICSGFNEQPEECSSTLSTETYSPGIGAAASTGQATGAC